MQGAMKLESLTVELNEPNRSPKVPRGWVKRGHHELDLAVFELEPEDPLPAMLPGEAWELAYSVREELQARNVEPILDDSESLQQEGPVFPLEGGAQGAPRGPDRSPEWVIHMIEAEAAWEYSRGGGVVIAHPDSGFIAHDELRASLLPGRDFVDRNRNTAEHEDGSHGLATASVIVSSDNRGQARPTVTGIAPDARLIPYRVAKKRDYLPVPVLLRSGMDRLRLAILQAVEDDAHVISISLGWLRNRGVERAVRLAVDRGLVICAAGGNYTPMVVWPAAYSECIALAACDVNGGAWSGSASGPSITATAPGHNVWRAIAGPGAGVAPSSGTSYATAVTAGLAALWLSHHGIARVRQEAARQRTHVVELFRDCLRRSCKSLALQPPHYWGAGLVNAKALLEVPISQAQRLQPETPTASLLEQTFPGVGRQELERKLESVGVRDPGSDRVREFEEEILAEILRDPRARAYFASSQESAHLESAPPPRISLSRQAAGA